MQVEDAHCGEHCTVYPRQDTTSELIERGLMMFVARSSVRRNLPGRKSRCCDEKALVVASWQDISLPAVFVHVVAILNVCLIVCYWPSRRLAL
jgi:hypothetical protein